MAKLIFPKLQLNGSNSSTYWHIARGHHVTIPAMKRAEGQHEERSDEIGMIIM